VSVRARAVRSLGQRPPADGVHERQGVGDRVIVRVVDRGPGIPPAQLERVFQPFYRAGTAAGEHRGSGLGLSIARGFVEANGGTLHVESLPGQGATFVLELPLEQPAGAAPAEGAGAPGGVEAEDGGAGRPAAVQREPA
jgi:two-component system sensor histidine kinase KdpD